MKEKLNLQHLDLTMMYNSQDFKPGWDFMRDFRLFVTKCEELETIQMRNLNLRQEQQC